MKNLIVFLSHLIFLVGCSKQESMKEVRWSINSGSEPSAEEIRSQAQFKTTSFIKTNNERISLSEQNHDDILIKGSSLKEVYNKDGNLIYLHGFLNDNLNFSSAFKTKVKNIKNRKYSLLANLKNSIPELKKADRIWPLQLILDGKKLYWELDYLPQGKSYAIRLNIDPNGIIINKLQLGSHLSGESALYPEGPRASSLTEVPILNLIGDGALTHRAFKVSTDLTEKAYSPDHKYFYPTQDPRFNEVQTYYFIEKFLRYYQEEHGLSLPFSLEAKVNIEADGKPTNTAFYFRGCIRLGAGDNIGYARIPQDPSIVMHETSHALVEAISQLPYEGEGGSINEAFADFLSASYLDRPLMAEVSYLKAPFKRSLENTLSLQDKTGGLYHDSLIISGTLWEIRSMLGQKETENFALKILARLNPQSNFNNLSSVINELYNNDYKEQKSFLEPILQKRGWL